VSPFLINPFIMGAAGGGGGRVYRTLTIDDTQAGASDSTDFPILVSLTDSTLKTIANGGNVDNVGVNNLRLYSDSGISSLLKFEIEHYDPATGLLLAWVKVPTVSHTSPTVIYLAYGDAANSSDVSDPPNVWTNNFARVVHGGDGSAMSGVDVVAGNNFTVTGTSGVAGQIYGGGAFGGGGSPILTNAAAAASGVPLTFSAWALLSGGTSPGVDQVIASIANTGAVTEIWFGYFNAGSTTVLRVIEQLAGAHRDTTGPASDGGTWHLCHGVLVSDSSHLVYQDGSVLTPTTTGAAVTPTGLSDTYIGALKYNTSNYYGQFVGSLDEVRIATVARSADWITLEWNNQKTGSTLITVGAETPY
jgi:hypothetical protein